MGERLSWPAAPELAALLRRYYRGEAGLWPDIQAHVHDELRARSLQAGPRHVRFRPSGDSYEVIVEGAEGFAE